MSSYTEPIIAQTDAFIKRMQDIRGEIISMFARDLGSIVMDYMYIDLVSLSKSHLLSLNEILMNDPKAMSYIQSIYQYSDDRDSYKQMAIQSLHFRNKPLKRRGDIDSTVDDVFFAIANGYTFLPEYTLYVKESKVLEAKKVVQVMGAQANHPINFDQGPIYQTSSYDASFSEELLSQGFRRVAYLLDMGDLKYLYM